MAGFRLVTLIVVMCGLSFVSVGPANAEPRDIPSDEDPGPSDGSRIVSTANGPQGMVNIVVHSAAMYSDISVKVLPAADRSRPAATMYLLNGAAGGEEGSSWFDRTDIGTFFAGKNVNVVVPMGGATNIGHFVSRFGPGGYGVRLAGLCDLGEEPVFRRGLDGVGPYFVCVADLGSFRAAAKALHL